MGRKTTVNDAPEVTTHIERDPMTGRTTEVRTVREQPRGGLTSWLIAGVVAVVAIIAVAFMVQPHDNQATVDQVAAAAQQGRAQGMVEGAQSTLAAQQAAPSTSAYDQAMSAQTARQAQQAAADAQAAAQQARSASDSASNAADRAATTPNTTSDQPQTIDPNAPPQ
jgi:uncharacterized membrane protein